MNNYNNLSNISGTYKLFHHIKNPPNGTIFSYFITNFDMPKGIAVLLYVPQS